MVPALEDIVAFALGALRSFRRLDEPFPEVLDTLVEFLGLEQLVRQRDKVEVEKRLDRRLFEAVGFREAVPQAVQVGGQRVAKVRERGRADMVADDEQKERLVLRAAEHLRAREMSDFPVRVRQLLEHPERCR